MVANFQGSSSSITDFFFHFCSGKLVFQPLSNKLVTLACIVEDVDPRKYSK